jgi:adenylate kinase family enzyme
MAGEGALTQLPDYASVLGLTDNPFSPARFEEVDEALLDDISGDPLPLFEAPALMPLFVPEAGPFEQRLKRFEERLQLGGYLASGARRGRSMALRIVGPQGSGKSTLVNRLVHRLKGCISEDVAVIEKSAKRQKLDQSLQSARELIERSAEKACCVVFDDVVLDIEPQLHEFFEDFRQEKTVVMFEVIDHAQDIQRPRLSSRIVTEELETSWLDGDQAVAFLKSRISLFRVPSDNLSGEFANFPFDAEEIRTTVSSEQAQPITLRTLNRLLSDAVGLEWTRRRSEKAVSTLSADELKERMVNLASVYARVAAAPEEIPA